MTAEEAIVDYVLRGGFDGSSSLPVLLQRQHISHGKNINAKCRTYDCNRSLRFHSAVLSQYSEALKGSVSSCNSEIRGNNNNPK
jgi:hypothetical protein